MRLLRTAWMLALRDLRGGLGSLWGIVPQVALGVALMAAVGVFAEALRTQFDQGGREAVGGDLSIRLFHAPADAAQRDLLDNLGTVSTVAELRPMARLQSGVRALIELKAVDHLYPLVGRAEMLGNATLHDALARREGLWGAAVAPTFLEKHRLAVGDHLMLGELAVVVRAVIAHEPDRAFRGFSLGPRVIVTQGALEETGLAPPGAPVYWYHRVILPQGRKGAEAVAALKAAFPDAGWRIVDASRGIPGMERSLDLARALFLLMSVGVLLVGGLGVGFAVRAHVARRLSTIATLKALGAPPRTLFAAFLLQVLLAAGLGAILGAAAGTGLAALGLHAVPDWLAGEAGPWRPAALGLAVAAGMVATAAFAVPPLAAVAATPAAAIWRQPGAGAHPSVWRARAAAIGLLALLGGLITAWTGQFLATTGLLAAGGLASALFGLTGWLLARTARRLARRAGVVRRLALANLGRPGAPTLPVSMVLGLALGLGVAVAVIGRAATDLAVTRLPADSPAAVVLSLPPVGTEALAGRLRGLPGIDRVEVVPFIHARISRLNGVPVSEDDVPRPVGWVLRGDRGLTWLASPLPGTALAAGAWWPSGYRGPPLASLDAQAAHRLGLGIDDVLTLATPSGPVTARIANLRRVDWTRFDLDFPVILSPPPSPLPHSLIATLWGKESALAAAEAEIARSAPAAALVRTAPLLESVQALVGGVSSILNGLSMAGLVAALLVLASAILDASRARRREAITLRAIGIGRRRLAAAAILELTLLGTAIAIVAIPLGLVAGNAVAAAITPAAPASGATIAAAALAAILLVMATAGAVLAGYLDRIPLARELRRE